MKTIRRSLLPAFAIAFAPIILMSTALGLGKILCESTASQQNDSFVQFRQDGTLIVQGTMNAHLYGLVKEAVDSTQSPLDRIWLNSRGGDVMEAVRIGRLLEKAAPSHVEVPDRATCQSACVLLLAALPGRKLVAPEATLMFHEIANTSIVRPCGPCGWLRRWELWRGRHLVLSLEDRHRARSWAAELSNKLPALIDLCPINPLDTQDGLTVSGRELEALHKGEMRPEDLVRHCPRSTWGSPNCKANDRVTNPPLHGGLRNAASGRYRPTGCTMTT